MTLETLKSRHQTGLETKVLVSVSVSAVRPNVSARSQRQNLGLDFDLEAKILVLASLEAKMLIGVTISVSILVSEIWPRSRDGTFRLGIKVPRSEFWLDFDSEAKTSVSVGLEAKRVRLGRSLGLENSVSMWVLVLKVWSRSSLIGTHVVTFSGLPVSLPVRMSARHRRDRTEIATPFWMRTRGLAQAVGGLDGGSDDVDTRVRVSEPAAAVTLDDADWPWLDDSEATRKRGGDGKRRSGRRRYDAYGVAGRFGRSADD